MTRGTSQQLDEILRRNSCLAEDRPQSSPVNLPVIRHDGLGERIAPTHDDVAAVLSPNRETEFLKGINNVGAGYLRELAHTASRSALKCSSGTGSPSS